MRRIARAARVGVLVVVAFVMAATGYLAYSIKTTPKAFAITKVAEVAPGQPLWVLLLGDDYRVEQKQVRRWYRGRYVYRTVNVASGCHCSDAIHLVGVPASGGRATIINIPRDLKVPIPGRSPNRVNTAYARGGAPLAARTVGNFAGVTVSYVVTVNFDGLRGLINAIGGVDVNIGPAAIHDKATGFHSAGGVVHMDGATALAYARVRKPLAQGDIQRTANQANLIISVLRSLQQRYSTDGIVGMLPLVVYAAKLTDLGAGDVTRLASIAASIDASAIRSETVPVVAIRRSSMLVPHPWAYMFLASIRNDINAAT